MTHRPFTMTLKNSSETCLHIEIMEEDITVLELLADIGKLPCYSDHSTKLETSGYSNWIYRLIPPESAKRAVLCLRIAKHDNTRSLSYKGALVQQQVAKGCFSSVVPRIYHVDPRFSIMDLVNGEPLRNWFETRKNVGYRMLVLDGIADFLCRLWQFQMPVDVPSQSCFR